VSALHASRRAVGIVLSGGGARCFAQIGALKAVEEGGFRVSAVCGTSTGALLGALYAAGHGADKLLDIVRGVNYGGFWRRSERRGGLISHAGVAEALAPHLPADFGDLRIPLAVTAVDIQNAELFVFREGPLLPAACASNAFPGLFDPVKYRGRYLMDGGILDNFPVDLGRLLTHDPIVAIDTVPSPKRRLALEDEERPGLLERLAAPLRGEGFDVPLVIEVLEKAYTITQTRLIAVRTAMFPPHVVIRPELSDAFGIQDFGRLEEAVKAGYDAAKETLAHTDFPD
jgi:NTE family protein